MRPAPLPVSAQRPQDMGTDLRPPVDRTARSENVPPRERVEVPSAA